MRPIDLPSNWISLHPGLRKDNIDAIFSRCRPIVDGFANRLLEGRRDLRALKDLPIDIVIAPVAVLYYLFGRFLFAKSFIASRACDGCHACVRQCPIKAIKMIDGRPCWTWRCESCMRCMNRCPERAIETAHGFVGFGLTTFSIISALLLTPFLQTVLPAEVVSGHWGRCLRFALSSGLMLVFVFLLYRLLHRALAFRVMERVVYATSPTHFKFWRRYRLPRPSQTQTGGYEKTALSRGHAGSEEGL